MKCVTYCIVEREQTKWEIGTMEGVELVVFFYRKKNNGVWHLLIKVNYTKGPCGLTHFQIGSYGLKNVKLGACGFLL